MINIIFDYKGHPYVYTAVIVVKRFGISSKTFIVKILLPF